MYPNDFLGHVNRSLRWQLEQQQLERENVKAWLETLLRRLEQVKTELRRREFAC